MDTYDKMERYAKLLIDQNKAGRRFDGCSPGSEVVLMWQLRYVRRETALGIRLRVLTAYRSIGQILSDAT